MRTILEDYGLYLAWLIAVVATGGSLYFSEVRHFAPCSLCWFQRMFMYPLVIVLGMASFRQDKTIVPYVLPLSLIGMLIAIWHVIEENTGVSIGMCNVGVPCTVKYINWLGFITIPVLSLTAFTLITGVLLGIRRQELGDRS
jgi:disulfide bond formation protein DsbB